MRKKPIGFVNALRKKPSGFVNALRKKPGVVNASWDIALRSTPESTGRRAIRI